MNLAISPHDDDLSLFLAFTCLRDKPLCVIVTDSWIQPLRGEIGCDAKARANETAKAQEVLGCPVVRLGIHDNTVTEEEIVEKLRGFSGFDTVFAPALQGGNHHHDMVARAAVTVFGKVRQYSTYSKTHLWGPAGTEGEEEVIPTDHELNLKYKSMACYESQINLPATAPHFFAVIGRSEFLT